MQGSVTFCLELAGNESPAAQDGYLVEVTGRSVIEFALDTESFVAVERSSIVLAAFDRSRALKKGAASRLARKGGGCGNEIIGFWWMDWPSIVL